MADGSVSQFTQSHSFVSGLILLLVGAVGVVGSVTGNLAGMIAALVDPTDLYPATAGSGLLGIPLIAPLEDTSANEGEGSSGNEGSSPDEGGGGDSGGASVGEGGAGAADAILANQYTVGTNTNATTGGTLV